ncbi:MAG TPA: hypothetical protein PLG30_13820 [Bacteroidia bacterium]|nr:hypothetical protein [Bacteroidia bacterium]
MKHFNATFWVKLSIANLFVVAAIGVLMRYKIGFSFPYFDQKNIQHAHSHFAFAGWISQIIMVLMVLYLQPLLSTKRLQAYQLILFANLFCAFGMLVSFAIQGYGFYSISFATLCLLLSFVFSFFYFRDVSLSKHTVVKNWFRAALIFNIISSLGTASLVYMMATKHIEQHSYLSSLYWYLHFQYNGWFFFACMGLLHSYLNRIKPAFNGSAKVFWLFAASCIPAYGLSVLWIQIPVWLIVLIAIAAIAQFWGWVRFLLSIKSNSLMQNSKADWLMKLLLAIVAFAATIKISLQLGSTIPAVSKLAFGFRPIVIAYLHLVLLAVTSLFLITYSYGSGLIKNNKLSIAGILFFVAGVFANELVLAVQGIASFSYTMVPFINEVLLGVSIWMLLSLLILLAAQAMTNVTRN